MAEMKVDGLRDIVLVGHSSSGKTSLVEAMLFDAGVTTRLGKIEEGIVLQQGILKVVALYRGDFNVGRDSAAAVNRAATVGEFYFTTGVVFVFLALTVEVIVVERNVGVVTLNQAHAGRVILRRGQGQTGILRKRIDSLNQPFAESSFSHDQAAIMILYSSSNNFGR